MKPSEYLEQLYDNSLELVASGKTISSSLNLTITKHLDIIIKHSDKKGVFTVLFTSLVYKALNPKQDIRKHQAGMDGGYSGRTFDTKFITPFLKSKNFSAPTTTGWLTRTLETNSPYNLDYKPNVTPKDLKTSFLHTLDYIQQHNQAEECVLYLLQGLIIKRNSQEIDLAKPLNLPIATIIELLTKHFNAKYTADGASRLPVLALFAAYECLMKEVKRFEGKTLLDIESHTSADIRSGRIGDIDIVDDKGKEFEAVEVKHGIQINAQLVKDAFEKFKTTQVNRYYLLSTVDIDSSESEKIEKEIERIKNIHGCHVIANGLINSLKYYLRLLSETSEFISNYVDLIESDTALKYEHKKKWNEIISAM